MSESEVSVETTQSASFLQDTPWFSLALMSTVLLASLAAVGSLMGSHHSSEAWIEQIQASDQWRYYQAKGIKGEIIGSKVELLTHFSRPISAKDEERLKEYRQEQSEIFDKAKERERQSEIHLRKYELLLRSVTLFQVAIAISAISVISRRKYFWFFSLGLGILGVGFFIQELLF